MNETDQQAKLQERVAQDLGTLRGIVGEDERLLEGFLRLLERGEIAQARDMLSVMNRICDKITRLQSVEKAGDLALRYYTEVAAAAALLVAAQKGSAVER